MKWKIFSKKQNTVSSDESKKVSGTENAKETRQEQVKKSEMSEKLTEKKKGTKQNISLGLQEWDLIKYPYLSEKTTRLKENNQYVFMVDQKANKIQIRKAIEALYKVKVEKVNIIHSSARIRKYRNIKSAIRKGKKAIITLAKGQKIEI